MSETGQDNPFFGGGTQRLEALADGVFSIVMTLLVFEIMPPKDHLTDELGKMLFKLWPSFLAFIISVGLVGIFWSAHRNQFQVIRRTDHALNWLNLMFLAVVSLLPFSTRLIASYHTEPLALAVYGLNLSLIGFSLLAVWRHATIHRCLVDDDLYDAAIAYGYSRCLVGACGKASGRPSLSSARPWPSASSSRCRPSTSSPPSSAPGWVGSDCRTDADGILNVRWRVRTPRHRGGGIPGRCGPTTNRSAFRSA